MSLFMSNKKFELVVTVKDVGTKFKINSCHTIHANGLTELCAKFPLIIADIAQQIKDEELAELRMQCDDIPF